MNPYPTYDELAREDVPGWSALPLPQALGWPPSFVSGEPEALRLRVAYFRRDVDGRLVGRVWFGPGCEGPPGHAHGGSIAALLDEAMGVAAWMQGFKAVAGRLAVEFRKPVPLLTVCHFSTAHEKAGRRRVRTRCELTSPDGVLFASAEGIFVEVDDARLATLISARGRSSAT